MDIADSEIGFDSAWVCSHCREFDWTESRRWLPDDEGQRQLTQVIDKVKATGRNHECDFVLGLGGGVDSSYLAISLIEWRPIMLGSGN